MSRKFKTNRKTSKQQLPINLKKVLKILLNDQSIPIELIKLVCPSISLQYLKDNKPDYKDYSFYNSNMYNLYLELIELLSLSEFCLARSVSHVTKAYIIKELKKNSIRYKE